MKLLFNKQKLLVIDIIPKYIYWYAHTCSQVCLREYIFMNEKSIQRHIQGVYWYVRYLNYLYSWSIHKRYQQGSSCIACAIRASIYTCYISAIYVQVHVHVQIFSYRAYTRYPVDKLQVQCVTTKISNSEISTILRTLHSQQKIAASVKADIFTRNEHARIIFTR